eukprot:g6715.t1
MIRKISFAGPPGGKSVSNRSSDVAPSSANVEAGSSLPTLAFFSGFLSAAALLVLFVCAVQCDQTDDWVVGREEYRGYLEAGTKSEEFGHGPTRLKWTWKLLCPWYFFDISSFLAREAGLPRPVQFLLAGLCSGCLLVVVLLDEVHDYVAPGKDGHNRGDWAVADLLERGAEQEDPLVLRGEAATPTPVEKMKMNQEERRDPRTSSVEPISGESCLRPRLIPWWFRLVSGVICAAGFLCTIHFDKKTRWLHPVMFSLCFASYFVLLVATAVMSAADERNARAAHGAESRRMPHAQQGEKELLEDEPKAEKRQAEPVVHPLIVSGSTPSRGLVQVLQKLYVFALVCTALLIATLLSVWAAFQCLRTHEEDPIEEEVWKEFKEQYPQGGWAYHVKKLPASERNSVYEWIALAVLWVLSIVLVSGRMLVFRRWRSA